MNEEGPDRKTKNSKFEKLQNGPQKTTMCRNSTSFARILKIHPQIDIVSIYNISKNVQKWEFLELRNESYLTCPV